MPGGDRTGPTGGGPKTGRGMGYCTGNDRPGSGFGRGRGGFRRWWSGFGRGTGWRRFGFGMDMTESEPQAPGKDKGK
jgi:hypothetical protein